MAAFVAPRSTPGCGPGWGGADGTAFARALLLLLALTAILETSIIKIPANEVGVVRKLYGASNLADGQLIATNGETGYQAQVIPPGTFRISPFFNVLNTLDYLPLVTVPQGFYRRVVA